MTTAPYSADTPALLTGNLTHIAHAHVTTPAGDDELLLLIDGYLDYDETRAPRVEAQLDVHLLTDPALLTRVDPRSGARVILELGYLRPDLTEDVAQVADLGLRRAAPNYVTDELTLRAASDEALVVDNSASTSLSISAATTVDAIEDVILQVITPTIDTTGATTPGPAVTSAERDVDKWSTIDDLADRIGVDVYDTGQGVWRIEDRPNTVGTPAISLAHGEGGTLVEANTETSREDAWANRVLLIHEWTDTGGTQHLIVAVADATGPYAPVFGNIRTLRVQRDVPTTQAAADLAAQSLVDRAVTRGRSFRVTAPSAYWLRPGDTAELTLPRADAELHLIASIRFNLRTGLMDLTTRLPE